MEEIRGLISIARKAGFVVIGQDNLLDYDKKLFMLLIDSNSGKSLKREMNFLSKNKNIPILEIENLGNLVAIENCKALGVKNKAFSDKIIKVIKGE